MSERLDKIRSLWVKLYDSPIIYVFYYALVILFFALLYWGFGQFEGGKIGFWDALYFSVVTITTLGYGDIAPVGGITKLLTGFEVLTGIAVFGLFLLMLGQKVSETTRKQEQQKFDGLRDYLHWAIHSEINKAIWRFYTVTPSPQEILVHYGSISVIALDIEHVTVTRDNDTHHKTLTEKSVTYVYEDLELLAQSLDRYEDDLNRLLLTYAGFLDPGLLKILTDTTRQYSLAGQNFKNAEESWGTAKPAVLGLSFRQLDKIRTNIKEAQGALIGLSNKVEPNELLVQKEEEEIQALVDLVEDVMTEKEQSKTAR